MIRGADELMFEVFPERYRNDPRFMGRRLSEEGFSHATSGMGISSQPDPMRLVFFPEQWS